ncbi:MAG: ADP-glyceromanno-heptose 6-epimerase [bacterium]
MKTQPRPLRSRLSGEKRLNPQDVLLHEKARILVTGAGGFIGSALVHALNQRGITQIIVTDCLGEDEKWRNLLPLTFEDYVPAEEFLSGIEEDSDRFGRFAAVFHLGACSSTTVTDSDFVLKNNYAYTKSLCRWALFSGARFVYASSAATYGDGSAGMDDQTTDLSRLRPLNLYGYSKHLFDLYAHREEILPDIIGIKYFNVFGPNEYHKGDMRSLVCKAFDEIQRTSRMRLFKSYRPEYADGCQMRDFVYVKDAVEMTLHLAENEDAGGLYNIGSGVARTWIDLATALFSALGKNPEIEFFDMPENIRSQYQYHTCADISKLRAAGYSKPTTLLEDAVRDYVVNYLLPGKRLGE